MKIDPNLTEEENLLRHVNERSELPMEISDLIIGRPEALVRQSLRVTKEDIRDKRFNVDLKNTRVSLRVSPNSKRWKGQTVIQSYRRIHLGAQWWIYADQVLTQYGNYVVTSNTYLNAVPTLQELDDSILNIVRYRKESLKVEVLNYQDNGFQYDTGRIRIRPIDNSLLYIGVQEFDVIYKPISFALETLDGFDGYLP